MNLKMKTAATLLALTSTFANAKLALNVYQAAPTSFNVTSTLITGEKEAILIDTGFTRADALRIAANILDSNKKLTTIFISQADPDYYFGAETLQKIFPTAKIVTTPAVRHEIAEKMAQKVAFWGEQMGDNAPKKPVLPENIEGTTLTLENEIIEVKGTKGTLANRPYLWIPSLKTITGNVAIYGDMHLWTADSASKTSRQAWIEQLNEMAALKPEIVIAGHMTSGAKQDITAIEFSKNYLNSFEKAVESSRNSQDVIEKMERAYPNLPEKGNLELGAKVVMGEMKW
ncbi:MBL fold metallo-hydrolase [Avibacterium paragallinarum]|uniref:MBL fold metallo-hydrolase n=1 Tax=Avibacterium paragallinarum TaxID=728 RepID=A0ABU7QN48_AVIPA|nr:MBL fold metallo-hydrolase [Avibacterium paragallinarum]